MSCLLADAVQKTVCPQDQLPIIHGRRCVRAAGVVFQDVVGQERELRAGSHHVGPVVLGDNIQLAVGQDRR